MFRNPILLQSIIPEEFLQSLIDGVCPLTINKLEYNNIKLAVIKSLRNITDIFIYLFRVLFEIQVNNKRMTSQLERTN